MRRSWRPICAGCLGSARVEHGEVTGLERCPRRVEPRVRAHAGRGVEDARLLWRLARHPVDGHAALRLPVVLDDVHAGATRAALREWSLAASGDAQREGTAGLGEVARAATEQGALLSCAGARSDSNEESRADGGDDGAPAPHCRPFYPRTPHRGTCTSVSDVISDTDRHPARPIVRSKSAMKFVTTSRTPASPASARP